MTGLRRGTSKTLFDAEGGVPVAALEIQSLKNLSLAVIDFKLAANNEVTKRKDIIILDE